MKGQISLGLPIVITLVSSIIGGTIWLTSKMSVINTTTATQDVRISTTEKNQAEMKMDIKNIKCIVNQMARKQQITCAE